MTPNSPDASNESNNSELSQGDFMAKHQKKGTWLSRFLRKRRLKEIRMAKRIREILEYEKAPKMDSSKDA